MFFHSVELSGKLEKGLCMMPLPFRPCHYPCIVAVMALLKVDCFEIISSLSIRGRLGKYLAFGRFLHY